MAFCSDCGNDKGISRKKTKRNVGVNQIENESLNIKVETSAKEPKFLDRAVSDDHISLLSEDLKNKGGRVCVQTLCDQSRLSTGGSAKYKGLSHEEMQYGREKYGYEETWPSGKHLKQDLENRERLSEKGSEENKSVTNPSVTKQTLSNEPLSLKPSNLKKASRRNMSGVSGGIMSTGHAGKHEMMNYRKEKPKYFEDDLKNGAQGRKNMKTLCVDDGKDDSHSGKIDRNVEVRESSDFLGPKSPEKTKKSSLLGKVRFCFHHNCLLLFSF